MDKTIKFLANYSPYAKGDIAGFNKDLADEYINQGIAKEWNRKANVVNKAGDDNATNNTRKGKKLSTDTTK